MIDNWKIINNDYLDYLRNFESRIPKTDYGEYQFKPFFGVLFELDNLVYVTQISSPKKRHYSMKNSLDFIKVYNEKELLSVVNLNYMFPVPKNEISNLNYKDISMYRKFKSEDERSKYVTLLQTELSCIKKLGVEKKALKLYDMKYKSPDSVISQRCVDFKELEKKAIEWSSK